MIALIYVDDLTCSSYDQDKSDEVITELEYTGISLSVEEYMYSSFGVEFKTDKQSGKVKLTQVGLTNKLLKTLVMIDSNKKTTPSATM